MPIANPQSAATGDCDVFLHVQGKRAGKIKGEARSPGHADDIIVKGWRWGLSVASAVGVNRATSQRSYTALVVVKGIDSATTPLMSALATNDELKEVKLTMRRAGGSQEDFFVITLKSGRVAGLQHESDERGNTQETVSIAFTEVEVEYRGQQASGGRGASSVFTDSLPTRE